VQREWCARIQNNGIVSVEIPALIRRDRFA
jgi:hypothetical protein